MHIVLIGATGRTGREVLAQALCRSYRVTELVRTPKAIEPCLDLTVVEGSALNDGTIAAALGDTDVVISALGHRSRRESTMLRDAASAMLRALSEQTTRPYIVVSQGLLFTSRSPVVSLMRALLAPIVADSTAMERVVQSSNLEWTIARPPRLTPSAPRGYRATRNELPKGAWSLAFADLAAFLLDAAESGAYRRSVVGLAHA